MWNQISYDCNNRQFNAHKELRDYFDNHQFCLCLFVFFMSRKLQQQPNVYQDEITVEMNLIKNKYKVSFFKKNYFSSLQFQNPIFSI